LSGGVVPAHGRCQLVRAAANRVHSVGAGRRCSTGRSPLET
jgi:hypothetical protein